MSQSANTTLNIKINNNTSTNAYRVVDQSAQTSQHQSTDTATQSDSSTASLPQYIDLQKYTDKPFIWKGLLPSTELQRLNETVHEMPTTPVTLTVCVEQLSDVFWFTFDIVCECSVICQRCLKPMPMALDKVVKLALIADENQTASLDEEQDWLFIDDVSDRVGKEIRLSLFEVIEDELLLDMPLAPKHPIGHPDCVPVEQITDKEDDEEGRDNPFASLASLKEQLEKNQLVN